MQNVQSVYSTAPADYTTTKFDMPLNKETQWNITKLFSSIL